MYTECSVCRTIYRIHPRSLKVARGIVRCLRCEEVFDAVQGQRPNPYIVGAVQGSREPNIRVHDDRVVLHYRTRFAPACPSPSLTGRANEVGDDLDEASRGSSDESFRTSRPKLPLVVTLGSRNLLRNPRRTSTALAAVGFGVIAFVLAAGFVDWMFYAMRESTIRSQLGHIQVTRAGFRSRGVAQPNDYLLPEQSEQISEILRRPEVSVVAPRLSFSGLASFENATISFVGEGVDPANEALLTTHVNIVDGSFISQSDPYGLFIGVGLAENLGVQVGDTLALVASTTGGGINAIEAHVRGVFRSASKAFDDSALRLPISSARELTKMRGSHRWVIGLRQTEQTDVILADLRRELASADTRFELVPWFELAHFYNKTIALFGRQLTVLQGVIAVLIVLTISNALVMSVLERTSEIGTMMALGQRRAQILRLFLTESVLLGALGSILGAALGLMLAHAISAIGIPMPPPPGGTEGYIGEIRTSSEIVGSAMLTSLLAAAAAGVYPSWRASRLQIVDALRHSR